MVQVGNSLAPDSRQNITLTEADISAIVPTGTQLSKI